MRLHTVSQQTWLCWIGAKSMPANRCCLCQSCIRHTECMNQADIISIIRLHTGPVLGTCQICIELMPFNRNNSVTKRCRHQAGIWNDIGRFLTGIGLISEFYSTACIKTTPTADIISIISMNTGPVSGTCQICIELMPFICNNSVTKRCRHQAGIWNDIGHFLTSTGLMSKY